MILEEDVMQKLARIQEMLNDENIECDIVADPDNVAYISIPHENHDIQLMCRMENREYTNDDSANDVINLFVIVSMLENTIANDDMRRLTMNEFNAVSEGGTACLSADGNNIIMRQPIVNSADELTSERLKERILLFTQYLLVLENLLGEKNRI